MINFDFENHARVIFGKDSIKKLENVLKEYNSKSILTVSGKSAGKLGIIDEIKSACNKLNIRFMHCDEVTANPKIKLIRELIVKARENNVDLLLAVGGGSPIDTAKAIALGIPYEGDVWDIFKGKYEPKTSIPIGAITTMAASGSETSPATIVTNGLYKMGYESNLIIPNFAIIDPSYTINLPENQTTAGCADIMSHLLERYFTTTTHVDVTDYLLVGAMKALIKNSLRLMEDPKDFDARSEIQLLASIAHNGSLDLGRQTDWASHRIEHELSGQYNITHGAGMAVVLIAYIKYMANIEPAKMAELANRLFDVSNDGKTDAEMTIILADKLTEFFKKLNLKTTLTEFGIGNEHFNDMAMRATNNGKNKIGHYVPLGAKEFIEVLNLAV